MREPPKSLEKLRGWLRVEREQKGAVQLMLPFAAVGVAVLAALVLRRLLDVPFWFPFLIAVITCAWVGGRVSGWIAVILSTLAVDYFFTRPLYSLWIEPADAPLFIVFAAAVMVANWFGNWRRRSEVSIRLERDQLKSTVSQRGAELEQVRLARELAERERRLAEQRWQAVFENAVVGVALSDERGRIIASNQRFRELLLGFGDRLEGRALDELVEPLQRIGLRAGLADLFEGRRQRIVQEFQRRDEARDLAWLRMQINLVSGTSDFPRFLTAFCEDISERRRAEEALLSARSEVTRASRLTTVGELTASIAHEVNQPLSAIVNNGNACLRWLAAQPPNLPEVRNTVNWIMRDARRASDVIAGVRALINKSEPRVGPVDLNEILAESLDLVRTELAQNKVQVSTELAPALPLIMGERIQLQQVFLNLLINAIEALAAVGGRERRISIRTAAEAEPDGVEVDICDNGPGIAGTDMERLFEAFFTTKAQGTGLGLWISRSIIENHSGRLLAEPGPEAGMCFRILLPAAAYEPL